MALVTSGAQAQSEDSVRSTARQLGNEGIERYERGDFVAASDRLERAYSVLPVATLGLWSARALAGTGKLVEASERYLEVLRMEVAPDAPEVMREAVDQARNEQASLAARIPSVTLRVRGTGDPQAATVAIDGAELRAGLIDVPVPVDPGSHTYVAQLGAAQASGEITVAEGEARVVDVNLEPPAPPLVGPPLSTAASPADAAPLTAVLAPPVADQGIRRGSGQRAAAFASLGVGVMGLAVGGGVGIWALGQKTELDDTGLCDGTRCPRSLEDDVLRYDAALTASTLGFVIGGVGVTAGTLLLITAPRRSTTGLRLEPWLQPRALGVRGRF